ncbi:hypothetical protein Q3G72_018635 [Acer saccharum]|nr:hypothetical protein Q3G72_018635 [Acer saccharum]
MARGESRIPVRLTEVRRDFRRKLVSIFVDNLNPVVDVKGLWGIFKAFGLVRDFHLSSLMSYRRSRYAFVRFASIEEAKRVVELTNGMHVYGWPILAKVANLDWNNRRKQYETVQRVCKVSTVNSVRSGQSYAMAVKDLKADSSHTITIGNQRTRNNSAGHRKGNQEVEAKKETMFWDDSKGDSRWLELSLVGFLRAFTDISSVIQGLLNKQIYFTFYYLGDKNVLWLFRSLKDRESFLHNRELWKGFFSSVCVWSPARTPQARLAWVEFSGIPLNCWCEDFFRRLGWAVGETLLIEEETVDRSSLANENEDGTGSDSRFSNGSPSEASDPVYKEEAEKAKKKTANNNTKPLIRSREGTINDEQKELIDKVATVANAFSGKGKIDLRKGDKLGSSTVGVNKGKKVLAVVEDKGDGWSSTSEEVGNNEEFISNNCKEFSVVRGLSQGLGGNLFIDLGIGLAQERCLDSNVDPDEEDKSNSLDLTFNEDRRTISNTVSAQVNVSSENSESHVSDTWNTKNYGLGSQNNSTSESRMIKESKGGGKGLGTCKRHGMVTCKDKSKVSQDSKGPVKSGMIRSSASGYRAMEEEVEKIIEKGTELGVFKGSTGGLDKERSSNATIWSTPEEITRVIEASSAIQGKSS